MGIRDDWQKLAVDLGFEFKEGLTALTESKSLMIMASEQLQAADVEQARKLLNNPLVRLLFEKMFVGAVAGQHKGYEVVLHRGAETRGKRTHPYVSTGLLFRENLGWGLDVQKAWFGTALGRWLFSGAYVRLPGSDLEKKLSLKAKKTDQARVFLADSRIQQAVRKLFDVSDRFRITDHGIRHKDDGEIIGRDRALCLMDAMAEAASTCGF
jgi:hypothetical protein